VKAVHVYYYIEKESWRLQSQNHHVCQVMYSVVVICHCNWSQYQVNYLDMKQFCVILWWPLFRVHWDISNGHNCENYDCLLTGHHRYICMYSWRTQLVFSSLELVSFSDARCPSDVRRLSVKLLYFRLHLQNRWANLNQIRRKSSLGKWNSELYKW
jgi:hypothetical protein